MKQLIALSLLLLSVAARGQEQRQVDVTFFCLKYVPGLETVHVPAGAASEPVRLSTANMSKPVKMQLADDLAVFHRTPAGDPKTPPLPAASIRIPKDIGKALVVLVPNRSGEAEPYRALLVDHGEKFRGGTYRVINFSHKSVRGAIGRSYIEAASGKSADLELQGDPGTVQGVRFEFHDEGRWNRLTETRCAVRKDRRWLLCIYQEPNGRMNMRSIPDRTQLLVPVAADPADITSLSN